MGIDPNAPRGGTGVAGPLPMPGGLGVREGAPGVATAEVVAPRRDGAADARGLTATEASHGTDVTRSAITGPRREFADGISTLQELIRWVGAHPDAPEVPRARARIAELTRTLRRQATDIREHLRTAPRDLAEDHRLLRSFYRAATAYLEGHRSAEGSRAHRREAEEISEFRGGATASEGSLRALRDQLRSTTREGTPATLDTLGRIRLSAEISRELGDPNDVLNDMRDWNRVLLALPESERNGRAGNARLEEMLEFAAGCETAGLHRNAVIVLNYANRFTTHIEGSARTIAHYQLILYADAIPGPEAERIVRNMETLSASHLTGERFSEDLRESRAVEQGIAILWLRAHGHSVAAPETLVNALREGGGLLRDFAGALTDDPADAEAALRRLSGRVPRGPAERMVSGLAADPSARGLESYDPSVHLEAAQLDSYSAELRRYASTEGLTGSDLEAARRTYAALRNSRDRVLSHLSSDPSTRADQLCEVIDTDRALLAFANHVGDRTAADSVTAHLTAQRTELRTLRDESFRIARDESRPRGERLAHIRLAFRADSTLEEHNNRATDLVLWQTLLTGADDAAISAPDRFNDLSEIFAGFHELRQRHYDERSADLRDDRTSWTAILTFGLAGESTGSTIPGRLVMSEEFLTRHMGEIRDQMVALLPSVTTEDTAPYTRRLTALVDSAPGRTAGTAAQEILPHLGLDGLRAFMELPATREAALNNLVDQANALAAAGNLSDVHEGARVVERPLDHSLEIGGGMHPLGEYVTLADGRLTFSDAYNALSVADRSRVMREVIHFGRIREYGRAYETALAAGSPLQHWHHARMMLESGTLSTARADLSRFLHDTRGSTDPDIVTARRQALEMNRVFLNQALDRMAEVATELYNQRMGNIELNAYDEAQYRYDLALIAQLRRAIADPSREISSIDEAIESLRSEAGDRVRAFAADPVIRRGMTVDVTMADFGETHGVPRDRSSEVGARYAADPDGDIPGLHTVEVRGGTLYFDALAEANLGRDERGERGRAMMRVRVGAEGGDIVLRVGAEQRVYHFEPGASDRYLLIDGGEVREGRDRLVNFTGDREGVRTSPNLENPDHPHFLRNIVDQIRFLPGRDRELSALLAFESYEGVLARGESPEADRQAQLGLARELRARNGSYSAASRILEDLMGPELARIRAGIPASEIATIRRETEANRAEIATRVRHRVFDEYDRSGIARPTQSQIDQMIDDAVALEFTTRLRNLEFRRLSSRVASGAVSDPIVRDAWTMYNDMNDPTGEWLNFSDSTVDAIVTEVVINAPLIAMSGGVASLAAGGTRMLMTRAAARYLAEAGTEYIVRSGGELALGAASRRLLARGAIWATSTAVEGATFEVTNRALRTALLGETGLFDHPGELGRAMGASILMMGAIHGGSSLWGGVSRRVGLTGEAAVSDAARLSSTGRALRSGANWTGALATEGLVLTGVGYANPMIFGGPAEHGDFVERFGHSIGTILQLRLGGRLFNALTGNALPTLQANLENRILQTRLRGLVEHRLGVDPTSADGRVLLEALNLRMASGTSIASVEGMVTRERLDSLRNAVRDRLGTDPASERGRALTALLLHDVMGRARRPEGMDAAIEGLPERLRSLDSALGTAIEGGGLRGERATELRHRLLEQALARGLSGEDVTAMGNALSQVLERGGFGDAAEAGSFRLSLLQFAIETGRSAVDLQALVEHSSGLAERVRSVTDALYGEGASGTAFGRNVGAELLTWAMSRATRPEDLPRVMEHLADAGPRIRDSLEEARRGLGFSGDSAEGVTLSHHLLAWALSGARNPAEIARRLDAASRESSGLRGTVEGFVRDLGYRPDSAEGARIAFSLLLQVRGEAGAESAFNATRLAAYANSVRELGRQVDLMLAAEGRADLRPHRSRILAWALGTAATPEALHQLGLEIQSGRRELRVASDGTISVIEHPEIRVAEAEPSGEAAPVIPLEGRGERAPTAEPDLLAAFRHADPSEPPSRELLRRSFALSDRLARELGLADPHDAAVSRPFREAFARRAARGPVTESTLREIRDSFRALDASLHGVDPMMRTEVRRRAFARLLGGEMTGEAARELSRRIREGEVRVETGRDGALDIIEVPAEGRAEARATARRRIFDHLAEAHFPEAVTARLRSGYESGSVTLERLEAVVESLPAIRRWIGAGGVEPSSAAGHRILNRTVLGLAEGRLELREGRVVEAVRGELPGVRGPETGGAAEEAAPLPPAVEGLIARNFPERLRERLRAGVRDGSITQARLEAAVGALPEVRRFIADSGTEPSSREGARILDRVVTDLATGRLEVREGRIVRPGAETEARPEGGGEGRGTVVEGRGRGARDREGPGEEAGTVVEGRGRGGRTGGRAEGEGPMVSGAGSEGVSFSEGVLSIDFRDARRPFRNATIPGLRGPIRLALATGGGVMLLNTSGEPITVMRPEAREGFLPEEVVRPETATAHPGRAELVSGDRIRLADGREIVLRFEVPAEEAPAVRPPEGPPPPPVEPGGEATVVGRRRPPPPPGEEGAAGAGTVVARRRGPVEPPRREGILPEANPEGTPVEVIPGPPRALADGERAAAIDVRLTEIAFPDPAERGGFANNTVALELGSIADGLEGAHPEAARSIRGDLRILETETSVDSPAFEAAARRLAAVVRSRRFDAAFRGADVPLMSAEMRRDFARRVAELYDPAAGPARVAELLPPPPVAPPEPGVTERRDMVQRGLLDMAFSGRARPAFAERLRAVDELELIATRLAEDGFAEAASDLRGDLSVLREGSVHGPAFQNTMRRLGRVLGAHVGEASSAPLVNAIGEADFARLAQSIEAIYRPPAAEVPAVAEGAPVEGDPFDFGDLNAELGLEGGPPRRPGTGTSDPLDWGDMNAELGLEAPGTARPPEAPPPEAPVAPVVPLRPPVPSVREAPRLAALAADVAVMGDTVLIGEEVFSLRTERADAVMGEVPPVERTVFRFTNTTLTGGSGVALALPSTYTAEDAARMVSRLSPAVRRSLSRMRPEDAGRIVEMSERMRASPPATTVEGYALPASMGGDTVGGGVGESVVCTGEIIGVGSGRTTFRGYVTEADGTRRPVALVMLTHSMGGTFHSEALNLSRLAEAGVGEVRFDGRVRIDGRQALVVNLAEGTPHVGLGDLSVRDRADFNPLMARDLARMAVSGYTSGAGTDFQYIWGRDSRGRPRLQWIDTESSVLPIDEARSAALRTRLGRESGETLTAQDWYLENLRGFGLYNPETGRFADGVPRTFQDALRYEPTASRPRGERSSTIPPPPS